MGLSTLDDLSSNMGMEYPHAVNIDFLVSTLKLKNILKQVGELVPSCWSFTIQCTLSA